MYLLILLITAGHAMETGISFLNQDYPSCFNEGSTWSTEEAIDVVTGIHSLYSCQDLCKQSSNCQEFTWYNEDANAFNYICFLYDFPTMEFPCVNCVSGPQSCLCSGHFSCQMTEQNFVGQHPHVDTESLCQDYCYITPDCRFYTWLNDNSENYPNECFLVSSCDDKLFDCDSCYSGLGDCRNISVITSTTNSLYTTSRPSTPTSTIIPSSPTTNTPPIPSCDIPEQPEYGYWFCPPYNNPSTLICHLECDPGYVSDNNTVIFCHDQEWSSIPTCVTAIALVTGRSSPSPFNSVEIYSEGLHQKLPNLPESRAFHSLDLVNSFVLVCGGALTNTSCLAMTSSQQWTPHSNTLVGRYFHTSISILGQLYILGGVNTDSTTEYLAPPSDQWHQSWDLKEITEYACAAKIEAQEIITMGGVFGIGIKSVMSYNVTNGVATRFQNLITGRWRHGCVYVKDPSTGLRKVLVAGGYYGNDYLSSSEIYSVETGEWATTGDLTTQRVGVRMVVLGDNVLAMGGFNGTDLSSVDRFNFTSFKWMSVEHMLEQRQGFAVTGVPPNTVGFRLK